MNKKNILLGVTGGIAAYKSADLTSKLVKSGFDVEVIMTKNATNFINPITFEALTKKRTLTDTFERNHDFSVKHISIADKTDVVIIAPATANVIASLAHGMANDMLTTTVLACDCMKIIAPAMNTKMYNNKIVQDNLKRLKEYGFYVIEPRVSHLACGEFGIGAMEDVDKIFEVVDFYANLSSSLKDKNVLVTAGATIESIDPVRYITNHSSGKMGYAVAKMAARRGANVTLISGKTNLKTPFNVEKIEVTTAAVMYEEVLKRKEKNDIIIMAAAVADYRPITVFDEKLKKQDSNLNLSLERTKDILKEVAKDKGDKIICGFAMETNNLIENAKKKLYEKNLDIIVANNTKEEGAGFNLDTNKITILTRKKTQEFDVMSKEECANKILDEICGGSFNVC